MLPPLKEAQLQRAVECLLLLLVRKGAILDYYHRPDRPAGFRERSGFLDLAIAVRPGLVVAIELKRNVRAARTTPEQDTWLSAWADHGALCRTLDEVRTALSGWGVEL